MVVTTVPQGSSRCSFCRWVQISFCTIYSVGNVVISNNKDGKGIQHEWSKRGYGGKLKIYFVEWTKSRTVTFQEMRQTCSCKYLSHNKSGFCNTSNIKLTEVFNVQLKQNMRGWKRNKPVLTTKYVEKIDSSFWKIAFQLWPEMLWEEHQGDLNVPWEIRKTWSEVVSCIQLVMDSVKCRSFMPSVRNIQDLYIN
jgi:hypothetical protein